MAKRGENARIAAEFLKRSEAAKKGARTRALNKLAEQKMAEGAKRSAAAKKGAITRREREARGEPPKPRKKPARLENKNYKGIVDQIVQAGVSRQETIRRVNDLARIARIKDRTRRAAAVRDWYEDLADAYEDLDLFEEFDWYQ